MFRPQVNQDNYNNDIVFQLNDWRSSDISVQNNEEEENDDEMDNYDTETTNKYKNKFKRVFNIVAYGITEYGNSISVKINGFTPCFFIKIPDKWGENHIKKFKDKLKNKFYFHHTKSLEVVKRIPYYFFTNNRKTRYLRLLFSNMKNFYNCLKYIRENKIRLYNEEYDLSKKLCETKVTALLRFFHIKELQPVGWLCLKKGLYTQLRGSNKISKCQLDYTIHYNDVVGVDKTDIGLFKTLSYDIECTSIDGTFPNPNRSGDEVIQIGTTISIFGKPDIYKYIATLKKCNKIEGVLIEEFETERDLIIGWCDFVRRTDPDIITGYNIWGFDWKYLYERANTGNGGQIRAYWKDMFKSLSRVKNTSYNSKYISGVKYVEKELHSSALGQNFLRYIDIEGIVQVDLYKVIQKDYNLNSYKLNNVSKHFMKQQKEDLSPQELFQNYRKGTPEDMKEIAIYCVQDCALCSKLMDKLQVIPNNLGMGNVCCIPFSYLFLRGQGIKIFSLLVKQCRKEDFIIKDIQDEDIDKSSYEGAIVFTPTPGIYIEPVAVMDYASLYPSSMIAENISHDSLVGFKEYKLIDEKKGIYEDKPYKDTINSEYDNLEDYKYNNIEYDIFEGIGNDKKKIGKKICRYAENKNGEKSVLPRVLVGLLKARKDTRKRMKYKTIYTKDGKKFSGMLEEDDENNNILKTIYDEKYIITKDNTDKIENTFNDFQIAVLNGQQLAFKITCNSLYGQVGATTSPICLKELAASTTATGRNMVIIARDETINNFKGSKMVYGDTDSVFINFVDYIKKKYENKEKYSEYYDEKGKFKEEEMLKLTIKTGQIAGQFITKKLKKPQDLEYEKVFWPFIIFSKKRYVGNKYEFSTTKFKQTSMGIVLKRRDNAPIVKKIYGGIIDYILNKRDIEGSQKYYKQSIIDLLNGKVNILDLIISKSLRSEYANPTLIPHKALADRMGERDPGNKPQSNERVQYCYIDESNIKCTICKCQVKASNCKCVKCMKFFCVHHIKNHKSICKNVCRFCKKEEKQLKKEIDGWGDISIKRCNTCFGYYCRKCNKRHKTRKDKYKKIHMDKCKKPLSTKLIQGDIVEEPKYITDNKLKIDYKYYIDHQIIKPVSQIFELVMKNPQKLIEDTIRKFNNKKKGNSTITMFFKKKK